PRPLVLPSAQYSLMMSCTRPDPPTIGSVPSCLAMAPPPLTPALKPLQRRRLITVMVDANDRRSRRLKLTPAGRALLARAFPVWRDTHAAIDRLVPGAGADRLRRDLTALT